MLDTKFALRIGVAVYRLLPEASLRRGGPDRWIHAFSSCRLQAKADPTSGGSADSKGPNKQPSYSSQYIGVSWSAKESRWRAVVRVDGKSKHIGRFTDERAAAEAYDSVARQHPGAVLNFIDGELNPDRKTRRRRRRAVSEDEEADASVSGLEQGPVPSSIYRGVYWRAQQRKWAARIRVGERRLELGSFLTEEEAARAYDRAARLYHVSPVTNWDEEGRLNPDRKSVQNLRVFTREGRSEPAKRLSSPYRGVYSDGRGTWVARITVDGTKINIGRFDDARSAAVAFDREAIKHYENPMLNFNPDGSDNLDRKRAFNPLEYKRRPASELKEKEEVKEAA